MGSNLHINWGSRPLYAEKKPSVCSVIHCKCLLSCVVSCNVGKAIERILQSLARLHWLWGSFIQRLKLGLQTASCGLSCVAQKLGQLPPNFLSGELVHGGDPGGYVCAASCVYHPWHLLQQVCLLVPEVLSITWGQHQRVIDNRRSPLMCMVSCTNSTPVQHTSL